MPSRSIIKKAISIAGRSLQNSYPADYILATKQNANNF
jgi:hypothetical protein